MGAEEDLLSTNPLPDLLRQISGIRPEPHGTHVRLDLHGGVRSTQRLEVGELGGAVVAGLWPGELVPQARYLYAEGRARALIAAARASNWTVDARPHLAFHTAAPSRRLYLDPQVDVDEYARRWEGADRGWIHQYPAQDVKRVLWPWLKERGYASAVDDAALDDFLPMLGRRGAHLRPGLRLVRRWDVEDVGALGERRTLADAIRLAVDGVLGAAGEPPLPRLASLG